MSDKEVDSQAPVTPDSKSRRGPYRCQKCGAPKRGHICSDSSGAVAAGAAVAGSVDRYTDGTLAELELGSKRIQRSSEDTDKKKVSTDVSLTLGSFNSLLNNLEFLHTHLLNSHVDWAYNDLFLEHIKNEKERVECFRNSYAERCEEVAAAAAAAQQEANNQTEIIHTPQERIQRNNTVLIPDAQEMDEMFNKSGERILNRRTSSTTSRRLKNLDSLTFDGQIGANDSFVRLSEIENSLNNFFFEL